MKPVLTVLGVVLLVIAAVYFLVPADQLPGFLSVEPPVSCDWKTRRFKFQITPSPLPTSAIYLSPA